MRLLGRKEEYTIWKVMRIAAYCDALFNEEGESRVPERAPKMEFPGFEAGGAESGIYETASSLGITTHLSLALTPLLNRSGKIVGQTLPTVSFSYDLCAGCAAPPSLNFII